MKALPTIAGTFCLMMIGQAVGQGLEEQEKAFAGHWALEMSNGAAGWMALELSEGEWSGQLWTVGEPKAIKGLLHANGKLTFKRALRIGTPEYPGGPYTGERSLLDLEATVQGDALKVTMKVPDGKPFVHVGKRLPPYPLDPTFPR